MRLQRERAWFCFEMFSSDIESVVKTMSGSSIAGLCMEVLRDLKNSDRGYLGFYRGKELGSQGVAITSFDGFLPYQCRILIDTSDAGKHLQGNIAGLCRGVSNVLKNCVQGCSA